MPEQFKFGQAAERTIEGAAVTGVGPEAVKAGLENLGSEVIKSNQIPGVENFADGIIRGAQGLAGPALLVMLGYSALRYMYEKLADPKNKRKT